MISLRVASLLPFYRSSFFLPLSWSKISTLSLRLWSLTYFEDGSKKELDGFLICCFFLYSISIIKIAILNICQFIWKNINALCNLTSSEAIQSAFHSLRISIHDHAILKLRLQYFLRSKPSKNLHRYCWNPFFLLYNYYLAKAIYSCFWEELIWHSSTLPH